MRYLKVVCLLGISLLPATPLAADERDALAIETNILARHLPFGTILNPFLGANGAVTGYTRCGDSALFTGTYLAAEAFRYKITLAPEALANVRTAVNSLDLLSTITGTNLLARCAVPADSPFAAGITSEEKNNGIYQANVNGRAWFWIGNTSRDQYTGVFFGLGAAYDLIPDPAIRASISTVTTRLLNQLLSWGWTVFMPGGSISTTFLQRPDQQLALLQIGRHVNPSEFASTYSRSSTTLQILVPIPLGVDSSDDKSSYFKFNLDFLNLYNLIRLEDSSSARTQYEKGFSVVRQTTNNHLNALFNMIDRALHGPDATRDAETRAILDAWLKRPRTDVFVDLHGKVDVCGNDACRPVPVELRPPSDFLWQLNPFQLAGGGNGSIETAGVDYLLPYWMARYYGVIQEPLALPHLKDGRKK